MMLQRGTAWLAGLVLVLSAAAVRGEEAAPANPADEPLAKKLSVAKAGEYLDGVALGWTREQNCGTCHTNYAYLLARPRLDNGKPSAAHAEVRKFFEGRVANWDSGEPGAKPRWDTEVVATAAFLALNDAHGTGKLHPMTRQALDRMWKLQQKDGAWDWLKCDWPPLEHDDYYGAALVAVAVGHAPDGYARAETAKEGVSRLRGYFTKTAPPDLHHRAMLLWASAKLDGLMTEAQRKEAVKELLAKQRPDGGWSLPSLGDYKRRNGKPNDPNAPSDGYATGFVVYVLRQAGVPAKDEAVQRGVAWLKANQRESGRWFTYSLTTDKKHYISNAGTSFAVLALHACDALKD
jgi:squalene-hopene/tetraprenyl-beta-curcumene cyclase